MIDDAESLPIHRTTISVEAMQRKLQRHHSEPLRVSDEAKRRDFVIGLLKAHKWRFTLGVGVSVDAFQAATATTTRTTAVREGHWREARVSKVEGDDITVRVVGASRGSSGFPMCCMAIACR